jgi:hypothetical protein
MTMSSKSYRGFHRPPIGRVRTPPASNITPRIRPRFITAAAYPFPPGLTALVLQVWPISAKSDVSNQPRSFDLDLGTAGRRGVVRQVAGVDPP